MATRKEEVLSQTTHRLLESLASHNFVLEERGKTLAYYTPDRLMKIEIIFLIPRRIFHDKLKAIPLLQFCSRTIKKWWKEENLPNPTDVFFSAHLCDISPRIPPYEWIISGDQQSRSVDEIAGLIDNLVVPLFGKLTNPATVVEVMSKRVWAISDGLRYDVSPPPLDYVLYYGSSELARKLFNTCIEKNSNWAQQAIMRHRELDKRKGSSTEQIFSSGSRWVNLAYVSGLHA
ncbi:MAG: hypothetical protein LBH04_06955 [Tannerellaceae bacterium]|jgi:hypothetical protein|nr:hypothetical protein [Tannerellaceae bacterium]